MSLKLLAPKQVSAANTATQLISTVTPCCWVCIQADKDNADLVYVGDSTVMSSTTDRGIILSVTDGDAFESKLVMTAHGGAANGINLADVYIASENSGAKVNVAYIEV